MSAPLFELLSDIASRVRAAPHLLLCCDFDGTLAPLAEDPGAVGLADDVRGSLAGLADTGRVTVVIISGRSAADLRARVPVAGLIAAGNHGLEIAGPGFEHVDPEVIRTAPVVSNLAESLAKPMQEFPGAVVEDKGLSVSVHYRRVAPDLHCAVRCAVHMVLAGLSHPFVLTNGRLAYNIRPRVYWDKAAAIRWIAGRVGRPDALVIYIGGDTSDEEAFAALPDGITIRVAPGPETAAKYHVGGPDDVCWLLAWLGGQVR